MTKAELRQEFLVRRKALTVEEINHWSQLITQRFVDFLERDQLIRKISLIHTFLPIQRQNEVDTWPIIRLLWDQFPQVQFAASITEAGTNRLTHYLLHPTTSLQINRWGIPEPVPNGQFPVESAEIDIVIVPLLAFDKQGHRVGYGGGYYDRFLADCRPDCLKIGLSLFDPVEEISDIEMTDIPLTMIVTPHQTFSSN